jgi:3-phosphoshikimate 1-carboxyvinyltransferase
MSHYIVRPAHQPLHGTLSIPGDKSIGHRALLFSLLTSAPVVVRGLSDGADNGRSAKAVTMLGATISRQTGAPGQFIIRGPGLDALHAPTSPIDCGNSGTTIRLLSGLLAGQRFVTALVGDESLSKRPMKRVLAPLAAMGAVLDGVRSPAGDLLPPLRIGPSGVGPAPLHAMAHVLPMASAQVKTALLLASLYADGTSSITEPGPSRDHSERMLRYLGVPLSISSDNRTVSLATTGWSRQLNGGEFTVPSDPSSAAFIVVAALLCGTQDEGVRCLRVTVNPTRIGFVDVLRAMGARIHIENIDNSGPEPVADLVIDAVARGAGPGLRATVIDGDLVVRSLDEIPILAVAAAAATGTTVIRNADELRVKESDRIAATCAMLRGIGVACDETADGFAVHGTGGAPFAGGYVHATGDHRIAMAGAVAGLFAVVNTKIDDVDNVATSYPGFVDAIRTLGGHIELA